MWIVLGEEKERIKLVSKSGTPGLLPRGAFLTIVEGDAKFILRVDSSLQTEPYSPSPFLADMDLSSLKEDQKCQNILYAYRVKDITNRKDGLIDYIRPQSIARRSNQEEIDLALNAENEGPPIFLATVYSSKNEKLIDANKRPITINLPVEMFYHQMLVCGKTGSGKTVATKYLAQYFVEDLKGFGAVLAINVKDVDFLRMDQASITVHESIKNEWQSLGIEQHGIENFVVYYPANTNIDPGQGVNINLCKPITLDVTEIDPEALTGLLQGISDIGAQHLPNIFRKWQDDRQVDPQNFTFGNFVRYFARGADDRYCYRVKNSRGDEMEVTLPWGTFHNVLRNLEYAVDFFDNEDALALSVDDILSPGKMSVINVAGSKGIQFGSIILRHLLKRIVSQKSLQRSKVPILIIIDEVHQFYNTTSSREALSDLDTICRTGRSKEIGVIFSSQNPTDVPRGLSNVINTKIFFKSDTTVARDYGIRMSSEEMQSLDKGYAVVSIHGLSQVKIVKFPLSLSGVFEKGG